MRNLRIPVGLAAAFVVGLIGYKDTGIFVNNFNAKLNNGTELVYKKNDRAEIVGEGASKTTYKVVDGENTVYIPKEHLLKVDNGILSYKVLYNTPLIDENSNQVIRLLFLDEHLEIVENGSEFVKVRAEDGTVGLAKKSHLDPERVRNIVIGTSKTDTVLDNGVNKFRISVGDSLSIAWFENDYYIVLDNNGNKYNASSADVSIYTKPVVEEKKEIASPQPFTSNVSVVNSGPVIQTMVAKAEGYLGRPYVWADEGDVGFDCSGLTYALYQEVAGIKIPRSSKTQADYGTEVARENLQPGDLVFFNTTSSGNISHVGLYIGDDVMIHASSSKSSVVKSSLSEKYYDSRFVTARRIID